MKIKQGLVSSSLYRFILAVLVTALLAGCALPEKIANPDDAQPVSAQGLPQASLKSPRGIVEILNGTTWSQIPASSDSIPLDAGQHVRTGDLSSVQINFPDGSLVYLQSKSELAIDEMAAGTQNQLRVITLTQVSGESQHSVAPSTEANSRYEVHSPGGIARAKGTRFNLRVLQDQTSYLSVDEGVVEVAAAQVTVTVTAGQMTTFLLNQPPAAPLTHLTGEGAVTQMGDTWTIAGQTYKTRADTLRIGEIHLGDIVHFEGRQLADGSRTLDLIILLQVSPVNHFRLQGAAEKITAATWNVNGQVINLTPQTRMEAGIVEGDLVWIEGVILSGGIFQAERIFKAGEENGQPFEFVGPVQFIEPARWVIAGITLSVDAKTVIADGIKPGSLVRAAGRIQSDGTWLASEIKPAGEHERQFEFSGEIESMTPWKVAGVSLETRSWTQIDPGLKVGDRVRVSGSVDGSGKWVAAEIRLIPKLEAIIILIGPVLSANPWVVNGISLKATPNSIIVGSISVGMLVRAEARLLKDGTWEIIRIEALQQFVWIPSCLDLKVVLVSLQGSLVQFQGWPQMTLPPDFKLSGTFAPNGPAAVRICISSTFVLQIVSITVITAPTAPPPGEETSNDKVLLCHKPDKKKGGSTMLLPRSALGGHLGHGDTLGACR